MKIKLVYLRFSFWSQATVPSAWHCLSWQMGAPECRGHEGVASPTENRPMVVCLLFGPWLQHTSQFL